jgi:nucleotide-binding universal stress UspA family protein
VTEAAREARWRGTELVIVNVVDQMGYRKPTAADDKQLDAIEANLDASDVRFSVRHIAQDLAHAADEILKIAQETDAELIVIGLKRRSAVAKAVLGSNAQRILASASCPVMAVRAPGD